MPHRFLLAAMFLCLGMTTSAQPAGSPRTPPPDSLTHSLAAQMATLLNADANEEVMAAVRPAGALSTPQSRAMMSVIAGHIAKFLPADSMVTIAARQYEALFTAPELQAMVTFFTTPVGAKYLAERPRLMARTKEDVSAILAPHQQELQRALLSTLAGSPPF